MQSHIWTGFQVAKHSKNDIISFKTQPDMKPKLANTNKHSKFKACTVIQFDSTSILKCPRVLEYLSIYEFSLFNPITLFHTAASSFFDKCGVLTSLDAPRVIPRIPATSHQHQVPNNSPNNNIRSQVTLSTNARTNRKKLLHCNLKAIPSSGQKQYKPTTICSLLFNYFGWSQKLRNR